MKLSILISLFFCFTVIQVQAQFTQTVRGTAVDYDSKIPVVGAKVIVVGTDPLQGSITDAEGNFKIEKVTVGRIDLKISAIGYQEIFMSGLLVESGKELVLNLEMTEDIKSLTTVTVTSEDKDESINKMVTVSGQMFTVDETNRYAGSFNDPARMVSGFAGVTGNAEGDNDIVVRGNSPKGILWRLEGIDIPNPNHFANEGGTGGPISALNGSMLANSDFFSGAFSPEYGNAYSGVFDVRFRQGNNEKREYSFSFGVMGTDFTVEGPFKVGYGGSYLVNYRYSTIALLDKAGILDFGGIPTYQDASFKVVLPTKKAGTFSLIGLGGISSIFQSDEDEETLTVYSTYDFGANLGVMGLKHTFMFNDKTYLKSFISASTSSSTGRGEWLNADSSALFLAERELFQDNRYKISSTIHHKMNAKNLFQLGAIFTVLDYNLYLEEDYDNTGIFTRLVNGEGNSYMAQAYASWKHRFGNNLTMISGLHYLHFFLNNQSSLEPRLGIKYQINPRNYISAGAGLHGKIESLSTYLFSEKQTDGTYLLPNKNIGLTKSAHFVVGYGLQLTERWRFKTELYYQHLYNIPVENDTASSMSLLNFSNWFPDVHLANEGTGRNYGIEFTLERNFEKSFYCMATGSIYQSSFTALDGIERDSRYDAGYAANLLLGKEFLFGENKNNVIGLNAKVSFIGGNRYTPINLQASQDAGYPIYSDKTLSEKGDDIFFINFGITYRLDKSKVSHSIKLDFQNLTNNKARVNEYFNSRTNQIEYSTQLSFIPNIIYTIKF
ncbi:MAG: TonB-dependent receptor [Crocinitomicaceae bacterium]|nr:TonB-dependent receptor [Crocinitomicaceae bacterium]